MILWGLINVSHRVQGEGFTKPLREGAQRIYQYDV